MKSMFLPGGKKFLAEMLTGSPLRINGLYVEYKDMADVSAQDRSYSYFESLLTQPKCGYARIPVHNAYVDSENRAVFNGVLTTDDLKGGRVTKDTLLTCATLVCMKDDLVVNDVLVYTTLLTPVRVVKGVYTNVSISLSLGD